MPHAPDELTFWNNGKHVEFTKSELTGLADPPQNTPAGRHATVSRRWHVECLI
jgi:hypothetical protein